MKAAVNAFGALSKSGIDFRSYLAIPLSDMWEQGLPIHLSQVLFLVCLNFGFGSGHDLSHKIRPILGSMLSVESA